LVDKALLAAKKYRVKNNCCWRRGKSKYLIEKKVKQKKTALNKCKAYFPLKVYCQDNAAMIAGLAYHKNNKKEDTEIRISAL